MNLSSGFSELSCQLKVSFKAGSSFSEKNILKIRKRDKGTDTTKYPKLMVKSTVIILMKMISLFEPKEVNAANFMPSRIKHTAKEMLA
jgi:hypothetical protein